MPGRSTAAHTHREEVVRQEDRGERYTILLPQGAGEWYLAVRILAKASVRRLEGSMLRQRSLTERYLQSRILRSRIPSKGGVHMGVLRTVYIFIRNENKSNQQLPSLPTDCRRG